jgi:hypothetical protein
VSSLKITMPSEVDAANPVEGDMYLGDNATARLTSTLKEEVAQLLYVMFRFFKGEWFLDPTQGTPWFQSILGKKIPILVAQQLLRQVCTRCPGVKQVVTFRLSLDRKTRRATVDFNVALTDGTNLTAAEYGPYVVGLPLAGGIS